jgi:hypothetical protein
MPLRSSLSPFRSQSIDTDTNTQKDFHISYCRNWSSSSIQNAMTDDIQGCRLLPYISHWQSHQSVPPATQSALNRHPASRRSAFSSTLWPFLPPAAAPRAVQRDSATVAWALRVGVAVSSRRPRRAEPARERVRREAWLGYGRCGAVRDWMWAVFFQTIRKFLKAKNGKQQLG